MKTKSTTLSRYVRLALLGSTALTLLNSPSLLAQTAPAAEEPVEKLVVTGSRGAPRTVADSPVPVDVLSSDDITAVSFTDTNDIIKTLVPSYSVSRQPISDGSTFIRPASMRGMSSDKVLVLVNGKRRHRAALVPLSGSMSQGPDLATIPSSALKTVEVLRDGAAAQYGSDAIAGVINFHLKDNSEGGELNVDYGGFSAGDGETVTISGNIGFSLGDKGFVSVSGEVTEQNVADRSVQYCVATFCLDQNSPLYNGSSNAARDYFDDPLFASAVAEMGESVMPQGQPEASAKRIFINAGYNLTDTTELYAYGNYSKSDSNGPFNYRPPTNTVYLPVRLEDGSVYSLSQKYPGGFTPRFYGTVYDYSLATGIKGEFSNGIAYDFSGRFGHSEIQYQLKNSANVSMGPESPLSFEPGTLTNEELQFQADFVKDFEISAFDSPLVVAFGFSYMDESYELGLGDTASYTYGTYSVKDPYGFCDGTATTEAIATAVANGLDCSNSSDPVYNALPYGSNGFPGYGHAEVGKYTRDSYHAYVDFSANVTERLYLQTAFRYEDYSDMGSELVGKIAGKFDITDNIGVRASYGTGFRAPTPGQQSTINVSTGFSRQQPQANYLYPANHPVAQALGAEALKPELSTNYTLGLVASFGRLTVTLDWYRIDLEDAFRVVSSRPVSDDGCTAQVTVDTPNPAPITCPANFNYSQAALDLYNQLAALPDVGPDQAAVIDSVRYPQNAYDTKTEGLDLVTSYSFTSDYGLTTLTAAVNYNKTSYASEPVGVNAEGVYDFENGLRYRGVFTAKHSFGDLTLLARANYYGTYENSGAGGPTATGGNVQKFSPETLIDLEAGYQLTDNVKVTFGARNIFDSYPDISLYNINASRPYLDGAVDWQGAYYYGKLNIKF